MTFRDEDFFDLVSFFFEIFDRRSSSSLQLSDIRIVRPFNRYYECDARNVIETKAKQL